jgi:hypothetical protein
MLPGGPATGIGFCVGTGCGNDWVTIKTRSGQVIGGVSRGCSALCSECSPIACIAACLAPHVLGSTGEQLTWNGTYWRAGTCGLGAGVACVEPQCVAAGTNLVATMCASVSVPQDTGSFCFASPTVTCVDVPFTFPSDGVVTGVLNVAR